MISIAEGIASAVEACQEAGLLPKALVVTQPNVQIPSKQALKDAGIRYMSAYAHQAAAKARRVSGCALSAQELAQKLVNILSNRYGRVEAAGGHLNFYSPVLQGPESSNTSSSTPFPSAHKSAVAVASCNSHRPADTTEGSRARSESQPNLSASSKAVMRPKNAEEPAQDTASMEQHDSERVERGAPASSSAPTSQVHQQGRGVKRAAAGILAPEPASRHLEVVMVRSSPSLVDLEFPLYRKYQIRQHGDKVVSRSSFTHFLVDSPLVPLEAEQCPPGEAPPCGFGSFHQQYWINGVLVAVGVVDVLPSCLSSKYFFWDPDLAPLALGKISAMKEIEWVLAASKHCPSLRYYYMGYYIHTCPKMRYKVEFAPADLLCPKSLEWIPFQEVKGALDQNPRAILSDMPAANQELQARQSSEHSNRHKTLQDCNSDISALKVILPQLGCEAMPLGALISAGILRQDYTLPALEQLVDNLGPAIRNLAVML